MKARNTTKPVSLNVLTQKKPSLFTTRPFQASQDHKREEEKENKTGLPDRLKAGIEQLSGLSLDDVKVHYNSDKPAEVGAVAYTQGTNVHVGPGQEEQLPHETWHVVQQKQGRVKPTRQIMGKMNVNDDARLEREANVMGANLAQLACSNRITTPKHAETNSNSPFQFMGLEPQGAKAAMLGQPEAEALAYRMLNGEVNVESYMKGVCYDAVAYVKYLLGSITEEQLRTINGEGWLPIFDFTNGTPWDGGDIRRGTAVGFFRIVDNKLFHASIAVEGTSVRGINGYRLGPGWNQLVDLREVLGDQNDNTFTYDNTAIQVFLSEL